MSLSKPRPASSRWSAAAALIAAGATSGGGLAALAVKKLRGTAGAAETDSTTRTRRLDVERDE
jgi:hypothetical protein